MMKNLTTYWTCLILSISIPLGIIAQDNPEAEIADILPAIDSLSTESLWKHELKDYPYLALDWATYSGERSPQVALIAGIVIPGGGQLYNRDYEKLLAYYAGVGGILYLIDNNTTQYKSLQRALEQRISGERDQYYEIINTVDRLISVRDQFRKNLELSYFGAVAFYLVGVIDGFVSAHLSSFDITDDISMNVKLLPGLDITPAPGISLTWIIQ